MSLCDKKTKKAASKRNSLSFQAPCSIATNLRYLFMVESVLTPPLEVVSTGVAIVVSDEFPLVDGGVVELVESVLIVDGVVVSESVDFSGV